MRCRCGRVSKCRYSRSGRSSRRRIPGPSTTREPRGGFSYPRCSQRIATRSSRSSTASIPQSSWASPSRASARPSPKRARWESPIVRPDEAEDRGRGTGIRRQEADTPAPSVFCLLTPDSCMPGPGVREARLLTDSPWVRSLGRLELSIGTEGWKFPAPPLDFVPPARLATDPPAGRHEVKLPTLPDGERTAKSRIRPKPTADTVLFKDRLLCLLQPPLDGLFDGRQLQVHFEPFPYQLEGIAFLMPRHGALLADEMGLGKTAQAILSMRLLFHQGVIRQAVVVCPKPLVHNWAREL